MGRGEQAWAPILRSRVNCTCLHRGQRLERDEPAAEPLPGHNQCCAQPPTGQAGAVCARSVPTGATMLLAGQQQVGRRQGGCSRSGRPSWPSSHKMRLLNRLAGSYGEDYAWQCAQRVSWCAAAAAPPATAASGLLERCACTLPTLVITAGTAEQTDTERRPSLPDQPVEVTSSQEDPEVGGACGGS